MPAINILSLQTVKSGVGTEDYVYSETVPAGETWLVRTVCAKDCDTTQTEIEVGVYNGAVYRTLSQFLGEDSVGSYTTWSHTWNGEVWLREGEKIYGRFATSVASDELKLNVFGEKLLGA